MTVPVLLLSQQLEHIRHWCGPLSVPSLASHFPWWPGSAVAGSVVGAAHTIPDLSCSAAVPLWEMAGEISPCFSSESCLSW